MNAQKIRQLLEQRQFPDQPQSVQLIETHISWVLITEAYAYKIKKPQVFSFLDFSTLDKRRHFCQREYELNLRLAPDMYLGVLPVKETKNRLFIGNREGAIIDYAVLMKRMDFSRQMDRLVEASKVTKEHMAQIAGQMARFHKKVRVIDREENVEEIHNKFEDLASISDFMERHFGAEASAFIGSVCRWSERFTKQHQNRFEERARQGFIVDGHGDLHSRNIFLLDQPVIFDCIEFNDDYRRLDVLSDIAFFCMDLDHYNRQDLSRHFLEEYLARIDAMPREEDRNIFHYYKMYRANVRLKVNALAGIEREEKRKAVSEELLKEIKVYYDLLQDYFEEGKKD